jgi:ADP-heptose:LPS heptosyltransferase
MPEQSNILIYRLGSLGDTVMALPAFNLIKKKFKSDKLHLLTNKPVDSKAPLAAAILGNGFDINEVLTYPVGTRNPSILLGLLRKIKSLDIDTVINITAYRSKTIDNRDKLFFKAAGVKHLIGFDSDIGDIEINPGTGKTTWEAVRIAERITELGPIDLNDCSSWDFHFSEDEIREAQQALGALVLSGQLVAVNAGTKMEQKEWGLENWQNFMRRLYIHFPDAKLVFVGAPNEYDFSEKCLAAWNGQGLNLCGKTSPRVSAAIIKKCILFIGHDSGPIHLAGAVNTPILGIFSCRNIPDQWVPRGKNKTLLFPETDCARSTNPECIYAPDYCVKTISPERVEAELVSLLQKICVV